MRTIEDIEKDLTESEQEMEKTRKLVADAKAEHTKKWKNFLKARKELAEAKMLKETKPKKEKPFSDYKISDFSELRMFLLEEYELNLSEKEICRKIEKSMSGREMFVFSEKLLGKTLKEIGNSMGVSPERVRQIYSSAHKKVQEIKRRKG